MHTRYNGPKDGQELNATHPAPKGKGDIETHKQMSNKKAIQTIAYKVGTNTTNIDVFKEVLDSAFMIEVSSQTVYDDGSRSVKATIHYRDPLLSQEKPTNSQ